MKKYPSLHLFLLIPLFFSIISCRKDAKGIDLTDPPDTEVTASLQGRILDENGAPVKDATVTSGSATVTTDANGAFSFTHISMSGRWGFVKAAKAGYFTGSRTILTTSDAANYVTIRLLPRVIRGSFPAASGGTVQIGTDHAVAFDATSVVKAAGGAYAGNVHVYATYIDPTDPDLAVIMPGDLRGVGADGKETGLQSFGMMAVELQGDAGEKLQLAEGKKATLTFSIPTALRGAAPASIPLWYFNDTTGKWMAQGMATRQGNNYIGQVGHFSFWNCDVPVSMVSFKARFKDQHGNALAYKSVQLSSVNFGIRGGITDSSGYIQGLLPKDQTFQLQVLDECKTVLYSQAVGPVTGSLDLGTVTATIAVNTPSLVLSGKVVDCAGNPVAQGSVTAMIEGRYYGTTVKNGTFALTLLRCSAGEASVKLTASNYADNQQSREVSLSVTTGAQDAGEIKACGISTEQYIHININGKNYNFINSEYPDELSYNNASGKSITIFAENASVTPTYHTIIILRGLAGPGTGELFHQELSEDWGELYRLQTVTKFVITAQGGVGKPIEGNFSGTVKKDSEPAAVPMTGYFRIIQKEELDD